jgi:hypothetical protein
MKLERGMGTLMTVFSGVAALMCVLVGLQLLFLEARIGRAADQAIADSDAHYRQWQGEVQTGAVMSFGAGILILLFGLRHQATRGRSANPRASRQENEDQPADLDTLSIRIFEVDEEDRSIEITSPDEEPDEFDFDPGPRQWAPLAEDDPGTPPGPPGPGDSTDSILKSISEATGSEVVADRRAPARKSAKSFWAKVFPARKKR